MNKLILLIFLINCNLLLSAQTIDKKPGIINGNIVDSLTNKPITHATISVIANNQSIFLSIVNERGHFSISNLSAGTYLLDIEAYGYNRIKTKMIVISNTNPGFNIGTIKLSESVVNLDDVSVKTPLMRQYIDKDVFNVNQKNFTANSKTLDVLKKLNGVSVTPNGEVKVLGKSDVKVLVDGRTYDLAYVKNLPAGSIKSVEVISIALSKFDAEGYGSVINIITAKDLLDGYQGNISAGVGDKGRFNSGIFAKIKKGDFNLDLNYNYSTYFNKGNYKLLTSSIEQGTIDQQEGAREVDFGLQSFSSNLTFLPDTLNSYNFSFGLISNRIKNNFLTNYLNAFNLPYSTINSFGNIGRNTYDFILEYKRSLSKKKLNHSLTTTVYFERKNDNLKQLINQISDSINIKNNYNNIMLDELIGQSDYSYPINSTTSFEAGAKFIWRNSKSNYNYLSGNNIANNLQPSNSNVGITEYRQNIGAVYTSYSKNFGIFSLLAGARVENTILDSQTPTAGVKQDFINFFPSLTLAKTWKKFGRLRFNYSRNIFRPGIGYINPFINNRDPNNITIGNINLKPEFRSILSLGYSKKFNQFFLSTSTSFIYNKNLILSYVTPVNGVLVSQFQNIGNRKAINLDASVNYDFSDNISVSYNASVSRQLNSAPDLNISNAGYSYSFDGSFSWSFNKAFIFEFSAMYNSPITTLQGKTQGFNFLDASLQKTFAKKITVGVVISDILNGSSIFQNEFTTNGITQYSKAKYNTRLVKLNVAYTFGKNFTVKRLQRKLNNNDQKNLERQ